MMPSTKDLEFSIPSVLLACVPLVAGFLATPPARPWSSDPHGRVGVVTPGGHQGFDSRWPSSARRMVPACTLGTLDDLRGLQRKEGRSVGSILYRDGEDSLARVDMVRGVGWNMSLRTPQGRRSDWALAAPNLQPSQRATPGKHMTYQSRRSISKLEAFPTFG